jgi:hypothetical protein
VAIRNCRPRIVSIRAGTGIMFGSSSGARSSIPSPWWRAPLTPGEETLTNLRGARSPPSLCCPGETKGCRPDAATTPLALRSTILPPGCPQQHWTPDGGRSRARAKEPVRAATVEIFPPDRNCPISVRQRHIGSYLGFASELNARPSPCAGIGPRLGGRKTRLTCGAPLRNRTVDLFLTMDHQQVSVIAAGALNRQNASSR